MAKEKSVASVEKEPKTDFEQVFVDIPLDISEAKVLELNQADVGMRFDPRNLPVLSQSVREKLSAENRERYEKATMVNDFLKEEAAKAPVASRIEFPIEDPLFKSFSKTRLRARPGWHQTWIRGDQFDEFVKEGAYRVVRKKKVNADGSEVDERPGEETGDVWKIKEDADHDLIQVEVQEELHEKHLKSVSSNSQARYLKAEDAFRAHMDEQRSRIPGRQERIIEAESEMETPAEVFKS